MQERKTYIIFATFALTLTVLSADTIAQPSSEQIASVIEDPVHIPDPNLRAAVREALNIADRPDIELTQSLLHRLTRLRAPFRKITELEGLQYVTNITELALDNNDIINLHPIAALTQLTFLRLHHNRIIDVSPLADLTQLTTLLLANNNIADVGPLANLANLTRLELQNNRITDVTPLANFANLEQLDTHNNPIFDPGSPVVDIPDPNLRATIRVALRLPDDIPVTRAAMQQMVSFGGKDAKRRQIKDLTGIEHATSLTWLALNVNEISNLRPLSNLTRLTYLDLNDNDIIDISPLANLTQLNTLRLGNNNIVDVSPLAHLTQLNTLLLHFNNIVDVAPLANLANLTRLELQNNSIIDHHPLDHLSLTTFTYDQTCDSAPLPLQPRLQNRTYPSIFAPFAGATNQPHLSFIEQLAQHDLHFSGSIFGVKFLDTGNEWEIRGADRDPFDLHDAYLNHNPNMVFLVEIRMRDEGGGYPPPDSPDWMWVHDHQGNIVYHGWRRLINFTHPEVQEMIVQQAIAVSKCGLYDGIFFDWWADHAPALADHRSGPEGYVGNEAEQQARDTILARIRAATRPDFLIIGNTNDRIIPRTGSFINGGYMESTVFHDHTGDRLEERLTRVENSLRWLEQHLREPRINALQGGTNPNEPPDSPNNLRSMRAITTLSLTFSDGYVVFAIGTGDDHYWYDFWDADLGRPVGEKGQLYQEIEGLYIREFTNGWAVYNHSGEAQVITLPEETQGVASGLVNTEHALPNLDGEMYLKAVVSDQSPVTSENPADVNGDGVVNIFDLTLVAQAISMGDGERDVNGDGVVNVFDLVQVAGAIGGGGAAPSAYSPDLSIISAADVAKWLADAQGLGVGDANFQRGIRFLEQLLAALTPKETTLLPNYPNPFNPETWIPYRLAREAEVAITIYDTKGRQVRRLALGNQAAGYYAERGKAAYWDGRNEDGEAVASGIYIYQFRAGDYAAARRMVIVK